jgi:hypothetical protein
MDKVIYGLSAATAFACAALLLRAYFRTRFRLLMWSGLCFCGLCLNNILLVLDKFVFLNVDLSPWRLGLGLASVLLLLAGMVLEGGA